MTGLALSDALRGHLISEQLLGKLGHGRREDISPSAPCFTAGGP